MRSLAGAAFAKPLLPLLISVKISRAKIIPYPNYIAVSVAVAVFVLCKSGGPVIISASEDLPDSLSVIPARLLKYVVPDDSNIATPNRFCKFFYAFL